MFNGREVIHDGALTLCMVIHKDSPFGGDDTRIWTTVGKRREGVSKQAVRTCRSNEDSVVGIYGFGYCT